MIIQVVAIKDRALNAHLLPWFAHTPGQAVRAFQDQINDLANPMYKHPEDYDLYHIGTWNDENGNFVNIGPNKLLAIGKDVKLAGGMS